MATRQRSTCLEQKETFDTSLEVSNDNHDKSTDLNREALHDHSNGDATEMPALYLIEPLLYLIVQNYIHTCQMEVIQYCRVLLSDGQLC